MSGWAGIDEFMAVAEARSFTIAAKGLGCSTSQVSREIARLEDRLGQRLFYRTTRHVSLTEPGERLLVNCRRLVEDRNEALGSILDTANSLQGELRMTCAVAYGERFVVPAMNAFLLQHPGLSLELVLTNDILDLVHSGLDLAIRFGRLRDSRLIAVRLASRTRRLCASPAYLAQFGVPATPEALSQHRCIRGTADAWAFRRDGKAVPFRPGGRFRCNSGYAVMEAARAGLGVCQLPDFYVSESLEDGSLIEILPQFRPEDEGVWAVYPHRRHLPRKVKLAVEHLQQHFEGLFRAGVSNSNTLAGPGAGRRVRSRRALAPVGRTG